MAAVAQVRHGAIRAFNQASDGPEQRMRAFAELSGAYRHRTGAFDEAVVAVCGWSVAVCGCIDVVVAMDLRCTHSIVAFGKRSDRFPERVDAMVAMDERSVHFTVAVHKRSDVTAERVDTLYKRADPSDERTRPSVERATGPWVRARALHERNGAIGSACGSGSSAKRTFRRLT